MPTKKKTKSVPTGRITRRSSQQSNSSQDQDSDAENGSGPSQSTVSSNDEEEQSRFHEIVQMSYETYASAEKKRKETEKNFLKAAQAKCSKDVKQCASRVQSVSEALEALYQENVLALAQNEDRINQIWRGILEARNKLAHQLERMDAERVRSYEKMEKGCIAGRAQIKTAAREAQETIDKFKEMSL